MLRATWRQLVAHKLRLALTAVAVVLGVAFVSGSLALTDTMDHALRGDAARQVAGMDVLVSPPDHDRALTRAQVEALRRVPGVAHVVGEASGYLGVIGHNGKVIAYGGPPRAVTWGGPGRTITDGRAPAVRGEFALDHDSARRAGLHVGDTVPVLAAGERTSEMLVGTFTLDRGFANTTTVAVDIATGQALWSTPGHFDDAIVTAARGVSQSTVADRIRHAQRDLTVQTGADMVTDANQQIDDVISHFRVFLLTFAAIALTVGSLVIVNTFTVLVAQRTREIALMRIVGASRRQVRRSVLLEACAVGVFGGTVGLLGGVGIAAALRVVLSHLNDRLPAGHLILTPRTVLAAYAVGVVVTVVAAYLPARRASRVAPVAALREGATLDTQSLRRRALAGTVVTLAGCGAMALGAHRGDDGGLLVLGCGLVAVLLGTTLLGPALCRPVLRVLSAPFSRGLPARIGARNALRNPRRTAATASALMIGLALTAGFGVVVASVKQSTTHLLADEVRADYVLTTVDGSSMGPGVVRDVAAAPGVQLAAPLREDAVRVSGDDTDMGALPTDAAGTVVKLDMTSGRVGDFGDGMFVDDDLASEHHWKVGQVLSLDFYTGSLPVRITGVYRSNAVLPPTLVPDSVAQRHFDPRALPDAILVKARAGADTHSLRAALDRATESLPSVKVQSGTEFRQDQAGQADGFLAFVYALLALAIITAVIGIVNTLALAVFERTREIGLLRAVGLSRQQLRASVRRESVLIAVFGAVLGLAVGIGFGVGVQRAAASAGLTALVIPGTEVVGFVVGAVAVGVLAAVWPARRAARLNVLDAIATE